MQFDLVRRERASVRMAVLAPLLAIVATGAVAWLIFALLGRDAGYALWVLAVSPFTSWYDFSEVLLKTAPLLLVAQGLAIGFRARVFNIGAEGQLVLGAIFASAVPVYFPDATSPLLWPAMMLLGILGGALWAAIAAFWRTALNANEILVTLMLSLVATQLLNWLLLGPWKDPAGFNFPQSVMFQFEAMLPTLLPGTRVNISLIFAVVVSLAAFVLMQRSLTGYRLVVGGTAPKAAGYAGFSASHAVWLSLVLSGAAAGLAGAAEVAGPLGQLQRSVSQGYGFAAIIVAYLGGLHPIGIMVSSLLMAAIYIGGDNAMVSAQLPQAAVRVVQGLLLVFYLIAVTLVRYRVVRHRSVTP
ncbi:ABC transporter permease [Pelagovum pacificum]|uniref:ABC transporter permease n=1 Tax=Pelagovum pacificum TaxID=2588711 RepID=A0A5C5G952_9RHOB|nr:ABC transporter permease [Pelagovum pacificum]QQA42165.1 ABC transporter permease [Pelagovum pacificum]TNY31251.1 ABC transporter permease [Pelagovum pacificum]